MSWGFKVSEIKRIHFELSNYCNLACPACARDNRIKHNQQLNSEYVSLDLIQRRFLPSELTSLEVVTFSGNVDEPTIHPDLDKIVEYFCSHWENVRVDISSNGSTRNTEFWKRLGEISAQYKFHVVFAIDGLHDTNHIYRKGSDWDKIRRNYKAYLSVPGAKAVWQFVVFDHNEHQIEEAREFSAQEGFASFKVRYSGRRQQEHTINVFTKALHTESAEVICRSQITVRTLAPSIFMNYSGDIVPCCFQDLNHHFVRKEQQKAIDAIGGKIAHNLNYADLIDIVEGDYFEYLSTIISNNNVCIKHCKENKVDSIVT